MSAGCVDGPLRLVPFPAGGRPSSRDGDAVERVLPGWDLCSPEFQSTIRFTIRTFAELRKAEGPRASQSPKNIGKPVVDLTHDDREGA